ncbi:hypothetical protein L249_6358, partial [Ophiocordyceps polyrhachis-furcata BCC 54312]
MMKLYSIIPTREGGGRFNLYLAAVCLRLSINANAGRRRPVGRKDHEATTFPSGKTGNGTGIHPQEEKKALLESGLEELEAVVRIRL